MKFSPAEELTGFWGKKEEQGIDNYYSKLILIAMSYDEFILDEVCCTYCIVFKEFYKFRF